MKTDKIVMLMREQDGETLAVLYLIKKKYDVVTVTSVHDALAKIEKAEADIIVIDNEIEESALKACRTIRRFSEIPILFISSRETVADKVEALEAGGDDYITKPYDLTEFEARIKVHLRRKSKREVSSEQVLRAGDLEIYPEAYQLFKNGTEISLYAKELQLLLFLLQHKGRVFSAEQIYEQIWGAEKFGDVKTVAVHIRNLRKKIEDDPRNPVYIETVRGFGYKFSQKM
ncbi:response regulator transcription factor [Alkalicoccus saliphilus]|uniref:DNA-binding response regulator n=1 Tax=Alkalicoccus saliphilus TaxID=200989 RepID=A0A2T4U335_9BACI|nr:response regulator transcription factor [Alkalicoccus saliphilus]PTL37812.1 DNA-binding response regulator [Alkalicoccus saliphilus]